MNTVWIPIEDEAIETDQMHMEIENEGQCITAYDDDEPSASIHTLPCDIRLCRATTQPTHAYTMLPPSDYPRPESNDTGYYFFVGTCTGDPMAEPVLVSNHGDGEVIVYTFSVDESYERITRSLDDFDGYWYPITYMKGSD